MTLESINNQDACDPLKTSIVRIPGIGSQRAQLFYRLGIYRAFDLLFFFPRDYQEIQRKSNIHDLVENELQTVAGVIEHYQTRRTRRGSVLSLEINSRGETMEAVWFNQAFLLKQFRVGRAILVTGKPQWKENGYWQMVHPRLTFLPEPDGEADLSETDRDGSSVAETEPSRDSFFDELSLLPIYPLTEGLTQYQIQKIIRNQLKKLPDLLPEVFPENFRQKHHLLTVAEAVRKIHFPQSMEEMLSARKRFVYQELFLLQLALGIRRQQHRINMQAPVLERTARINSRIRRLIPFELTDSQNQVIEEISNDMAKPVPMNRLLQGDVGSGKTIVAVYAILQAVANDYQAVFMAPTEILARQHYQTLSNLLKQSQVQIAPLFGGQKPNERSEILEKIRSGECQLIVGTQAIICNTIDFHKLGLVVIDEQHKFGVRQRASLKTGTRFDPHYLVMTATPIPRSITMTLFGDLDVSLMRGLPPGRQHISTTVADSSRRGQWWDFFRKKLQQGRQGYVVVPRVDEMEQEELLSVRKVYDELSQGELKNFKLAILHGRLSNEEKENVMEDFRNKKTDVLISTSVIEVGIDVPNATLMTIENAERFGLAQLHQLRGRIGRGNYPGFCCVFPTEVDETSVKNGPGKKTGQEQPQDSGSELRQEKNRERLEFFAQTSDGFLLAEKDLELRGPGELFGTQQHGIPPFRIADLIRDRDLLIQAKKAADEMLAADPGLNRDEHSKLRKQVLNRYGSVLELGDVG